MNANVFEKANRIIRSCDVAYIGLADEDGYPMVSTIATINPESMFEAFFATGIHSNKYKCLLKNKKGSVCYHSGGDNITLIGDIEILFDQQSKSRFWQDDFIEFYTLGANDPIYCVLKFTTQRALLWIDNESSSYTIEELLSIQSRCGLLCNWCSFKETHGCGGCEATNGKPFHGECPIAKCCQDKGFAHCGECPDLPCGKLRAYSFEDEEHGDDPPGARVEVCRSWAGRFYK
jgi:general stress protein 26